MELDGLMMKGKQYWNVETSKIYDLWQTCLNYTTKVTDLL